MFSLPTQFLHVYYENYKDRIGTDFESFSNTVKGMDPDAVDQMADFLYQDRYQKRIPRKQFDELTLLPGWRDEQPNWFQVVTHNIGERGTDLAAGGITSLAAMAEWANRNVPIGVSEQVREQGGRDALTSMLRGAAKVLKDTNFKYGDETRVTWEEFKEAPAKQFLPFALEHGLVSTPDMAAAILNLPAYVTARTGEIAGDRAENDMRDEATVEDVVKAMPAAAAASMMERLGAAKVFGLGDDAVEATLGGAAKELGKRAGTESATEAVQEPTEQVGAGMGTEAWAKKSSEEIAMELLESSAQGAVVGLGFGGMAGGASMATERAVGRRGPKRPETTPEPEPEPQPEPEPTRTGRPGDRAGVLSDRQETPADAAPLSDAERSMESLVLEEEANAGKRRAIPVEDLAVGDRVTVDTMTGPNEVGTVIDATPDLVRIADDAGSPIAVIRPGSPAPDAPRVYSVVELEEDVEAAAIRENTQETARLIKRTIDNPEDANAVDQLRKVRNSKEFGKLPEESRNKIDDHLQKLQEAEDQREAEAKAAEEQKKADAKRAEDQEKAKAKAKEEAQKSRLRAEEEAAKARARAEAEMEAKKAEAAATPSEAPFVDSETGYTLREIRDPKPPYPDHFIGRDGRMFEVLSAPEKVEQPAKPAEPEPDAEPAVDKTPPKEPEAEIEPEAISETEPVSEPEAKPAKDTKPEKVKKPDQPAEPEQDAEAVVQETPPAEPEVDTKVPEGPDEPVTAGERANSLTSPGGKPVVAQKPETVPEPEPDEAPEPDTTPPVEPEAQTEPGTMPEEPETDAPVEEPAKDTKPTKAGQPEQPTAPAAGTEAEAQTEPPSQPEVDTEPPILLDPRGNPFPRITSVRTYAHFKGIDATPVKIKGGYGLRPNQPIEPGTLPEYDPKAPPKPSAAKKPDEPQAEPEADTQPEVAPETRPDTTGRPKQPDEPEADTVPEAEPAPAEPDAQTEPGKMPEEPGKEPAPDEPGPETEPVKADQPAQPDEPEADQTPPEGDTTAPITDISDRSPDSPTEPEQDAPPEAPGPETNPRSALAGAIRKAVQDGEKLDNPKLFKLADEAFGGTVGEGAYTPQDAYNAAEQAINQMVTETSIDFQQSVDEAKTYAEELGEIVDRTATQTRRTADKQDFQQFSTPPPYAFAAARAANIQPGDRVLEPSAGNGGLAVFARAFGGEVDVNEIDQARADTLRDLGFENVTQEDAEQIANIMEPETHDVVLMNPPFSAAGNRGIAKNNAVGGKHVLEAVDMLRPGGRLVAIMGQGFTPENARVKGVFQKMGKEGQFQAIVGVDGSKIYRKYGTTFDNQVIIYDKTGVPNDPAATITGQFDTVPDLIEALEDPRNARPLAGHGDRPPVQEAPQRPGRPEPGSAPVVATGDREPDLPQRSPAGEGTRRPDASVSGRPVRDRTDGDTVAGTERLPGDEAPDGSGTTGQRNDGGVRKGGSVKTEQVKAKRAKEEAGTAFSEYRPSRVRAKGAKKHPAKLVESTAMATVDPPMPKYVPKIDKATVKAGALSDAQMEVITYAGEAHSKRLNDGKRRGFLIGDGTGVGKGREIAGIMKDNFAQGRKKAVWVSQKTDLRKDAQRDAEGVDLGMDIIDATSSQKATKLAGDGVAFVTYNTLSARGTAQDREKAAQGPKVEGQPGYEDYLFPNIGKLVEWFGEDYDGVIAFDESHAMSNAIGKKGSRGKIKPSDKATAGLALARRLPNARVVYVSATGATEVDNLSYLERLGLWGQGTAFPDVGDFINKIGAGGVAAMEMVARDMKQMGGYMARSISFQGVEYENLTHDLSPEQSDMYDTAARGWQTVLQNIGAALEVLMPGADQADIKKKSPMSQFWGAHQRFFNQVLTSMQMPTVIKQMESDLEAGLAPVIQIVNTNEAATKRALGRMQEGDQLEDIDITPKRTLIDMVEKSFPVNQYETVVDDNGNPQWQLVTDSEGNPVVNREALAMRDALLRDLADLRLPGNPLDMILDQFGYEKVAEITGRSERVVEEDGKKVKQRRTLRNREAEAEQFQAGKRDILVFSAAGGTGSSFHSDLTAENQKRRSHYILQAGWRADDAVQGFGRTHRSNQKEAPIYRLAQTNLAGHKRFIATIARRLDQLGALTKGQRDATSTGMFSAADNLENEYAHAAVEDMFRDVLRGEGVMTEEEVETLMGIKLTTGDGQAKDVPMSNFLNRLLSLPTDMQDKVFEDFSTRMEEKIEAARQAGTLDMGVETVQALGAEVKQEEVIHTDEATGAETKYAQIEIERPLYVHTWESAVERRKPGTKYVKNKQSGRVYQITTAARRTDRKTGAVIDQIARRGPISLQYMDRTEITKDKYTDLTTEQAKKIWNEEVEKAPETTKSTLHMLTGSLLPIYDRLNLRQSKVQRVVLSDGGSYLGRLMNSREARETMDKFGVGVEREKFNAAQILQGVGMGAGAQLSNDVRILKKTVSGEDRIALLDVPYGDRKRGGTLESLGFQSEIINYSTYFFVPKGDAGTSALETYMQGKDVVRFETRDGTEVTGDMLKAGKLGTDRAQAKDLDRVWARRDKITESMSQDDVQRIALDVHEILKRIVPYAKREVRNIVHSTSGQRVLGREYGGVIQVGLQGNFDVPGTARHEAIHALRTLGLFTNTEWAELSSTALKQGWVERHQVKSRWGDTPRFFDKDGKPTEAAIEEAIAEEFVRYVFKRTKKDRLSQRIKNAFDRMVEFFHQLVSVLRGHGFTPTPGNIFDQVETGQIGARRPMSGGQRGERQQPVFNDPETERRWTESAKGVKPNKGRFKEAVAQEWRRLTRAREHIPQVAHFADLTEKLVHLEQSEHAAKEHIRGLFDRVMGDLNADDIDLMTRKMVLDDLLWSSEQGMDLPFGLKTTDDVLDALKDVEAALAARPELQERLDIRRKEAEDLKTKLIATGVLTYKQARNPHYFRHQVLEYAELRAQAETGSRKVKATYWHPRRGSEKDINANYFQAEADWMFKAHQDIATATFLNYLRHSKYNRKKAMVRQAKAHNNSKLQAKLAADEHLAKDYAKKGRNIAIAVGYLRQAIKKMDPDQVKLWIDDRHHRTLDNFMAGAGAKAALDTSETAKVFGLFRELADSRVPIVSEKAGIVIGATFKRRQFITRALGNDYINPQKTKELVKRFGGDEDMSIWQPDSYDGKKRAIHIFTGKTVTEHVLDRAMDNLQKVVGKTLTKEDADAISEMLSNGQNMRMLGGPMEEMILDTRVSETLNEFYDAPITSVIDGLAVTLQGRWKQWTLFNPARFAKYYLNNMTGDIDALMATSAGRKVIGKVPQAWREVRGMIRDGELTPTLEQALDKGVIQSSLVMQEIQGMGALAEDSFRLDKAAGFPIKMAKGYFGKVQNVARLRENAFRYAAYLHYRSEMQAGKSLMEIGYGASPPWMVEGITSQDDRAARMARDIMGDYGSIPYRAKWARKRVIPFVSWIASNTTRYVNLFRNAYLYGRDVSASKGLAMGALTSAGLGARIFLFYGAVQLWNNLLFGDDEELLGTEERIRMHLNLGRWNDEVVTLRFSGALSDFAQWFGMEDAGAAIAEIQSGRASYGDIIEAVAKAPVNRIVQATTPLYKLPVELTLGQKFFPDVFNPRVVRDRTRHAAQTFSLDYPTALAKQAMGQSAPVKPPEKIAAGVLLNFRDPGQIAYDSIRGKAFAFVRRETGASIGSRPGGKSQALYNYRLARKRGDANSMRLALEELKKYPGVMKSMKRSMDAAAPLGMMNKSLRARFIATLSPKERDQLKRARQWWGH